MRSCEVHALQWHHIDFEHRLIKIRQNLVAGELGDVKTPKSRRDLILCDALYDAFKRRQMRNNADSSFVFCQANGNGLGTKFVSQQ